MNELLSRLAMLAGGISLFAGTFHMLHYLRAGRRRTDLLFGLACLPAAAYAFACSGLYLAPSPVEGAFWARLQWVFLSLLAVAALLFTRALTGKTWAWLDRGFGVFFVAGALLAALAPGSLISSGIPAVKRLDLFGRWPVAYQEAGGTWFTATLGVTGFLLMVYVAVALFRALDGGRRGTIVPVLVGTLFLNLAEINDLLIILRAYPFIYLTEFGFLAWVLGMAVSLGEGHRATYHALEEREATQRALLAAIPDAIFRIRREGTLTDYRPGGKVTPFIPPEQFLGRSAFEVLPPGPAAQLREAMERAFRSRETQEFEYSLPFPGGERWFEGRVATVGWEDAILFARDITGVRESEERLRQSLQEKEVLLKEIHHRVKNNLHVISGLLDVQAHHIPDPAGREVYRESRNRVLTMALIHQKLYESRDLEQVDFGVYLGSLAQALAASSGTARVRLALDLASAQMVVDTAIPCGLIANELISNAFKHAFPGGRAGTVTVRFRSTGERRYLLEVVDDGAGLPPGFDPSGTLSLGLQLVTMLTSQLGGELRVEAGGGEGQGARFTIEFSEYREAGTALHPSPRDG